MTILLIAMGGALGAVARYLSVIFSERVLGTGFPWGTLCVNVIGSFLMGLAVAAFLELREEGGNSPLVMTGFLGGFTTFSAFSLDAINLMQAGRPGAMLAYAGGSVILALVALILGMLLARWYLQ